MCVHIYINFSVNKRKVPLNDKLVGKAMRRLKFDNFYPQKLAKLTLRWSKCRQSSDVFSQRSVHRRSYTEMKEIERNDDCRREIEPRNRMFTGEQGVFQISYRLSSLSVYFPFTPSSFCEIKCFSVDHSNLFSPASIIYFPFLPFSLCIVVDKLISIESRYYTCIRIRYQMHVCLKYWR